MINPRGPHRNPNLKPLPGPSPLKRELKASDFSPSPSPEPAPPPIYPRRKGVEGQRPEVSATPLSPTDGFIPTPGSLLANLPPARKPAQRPPPPDSRTAESGPVPRNNGKAPAKLPVGPSESHGTLLEHSAPQRGGTESYRRSGSTLDLDQAMAGMKTADAELAQVREQLESGKRHLRTAEYTLNTYRKNPPELIDARQLAAMVAEVDGKGRALTPLQNRAEQALRNAEERRRDVRASLQAD